MDSMISNHIAKMSPIIIYLVRSGRFNTYVLSLLATETFFRDRLQRMLEFFAWIVLSIFWPSRVSTLSIGVAQVQIRHWISLGFLQSPRPHIRSLMTVLDPKVNYDVCHAYLRKHEVDQTSNMQDIALIYRGAARGHYTLALATCFKQLDNLLNDNALSNYTELRAKIRHSS